MVKNQLQAQPGVRPGLSSSWSEDMAHMEEEKYLSIPSSNLKALILISTRHEPLAAPGSICSTVSLAPYLSGPWGLLGKAWRGIHFTFGFLSSMARANLVMQRPHF